MANIGGLSGSTSSSLSTIRGYGGLASGLDRDSLIEGMTQGTKSKIDMQLQKKQKVQWQMDSYRAISSKLIGLSSKYMSYSSPTTNLSSPSFFARSQITANGANSKYINVSGTSNGTDNFSVIGVKQMASDAKLTTKGDVSDKQLSTGELALTTDVQNLEGASISIKYGSDTYTVDFPSGTASDGTAYDYSTMENAKNSIQKALAEVDIGGGKTLADKVTIDEAAGKFTLKAANSGETNTIKLVGGTKNALQNMGFLREGETIDALDDARTHITQAGLSGVENADTKLVTNKNFFDTVAGKNISFTYNGVQKSITLPERDKLNNWKELQEAFQNGLDKAFGKGRITVGRTDPSDPGNANPNPASATATLQFKTTLPNGSDDASSSLSVSNADSGMLGKSGVFGMNYGESNRLNVSSSLLESGLGRIPAGKTADSELKFKINGAEITAKYGSSITDIMDQINNNEDAGVTISYLKSSDKFVITSKNQGAGGQIDLTQDASDTEAAEAINMLFGSAADYDLQAGKDAIVTVKYDGSDTSEDIVRGSNTISLDGLNITVKQKFGFDEREEPVDPANPGGDKKIVYTEKADNEAITFTGKVDSEKILNTVKDFIKEYNEMLQNVNSEVMTKPDRDYQPLTDAQKAEMTEDQIKAWEDKAKAGMLFNDSTLRSLSDDLRFVLALGSEEKKVLASAGITVSDQYGDNGKLILNEEKFKSALEANPEAIKDVFTRPSDDAQKDKGGLMARVKNVTELYANTDKFVKGILITRAGSPSVPTSMLKNGLLTEMNSIDSIVENLKEKLEIETDRYIKQFTNLETLVSQMNSQSSWLSQQLGS